MVNIHVAYTQPINPQGVTPVLTRAQLWAALNRKVRRAHDFVPVFEDCKVIEEYDNVVVRETRLRSAPAHGVPGNGPPGSGPPSNGPPVNGSSANGPPATGPPGKNRTVREVCKLYEPCKVDFHEPTGAVITNTVSDGPGMTDQDLYMTYFFEWLHPDVEAGSEKEKTLTEEHRRRSKMSVDKSIEAIRRMAIAGEL